MLKIQFWISILKKISKPITNFYKPYLGGRISDDALEVNMPKVNDRFCAYYWGITTDSRICAGGNGNKEIGICSVSLSFKIYNYIAH